MDALLLVLGVGVALLIAYFTYGRWVAGRVFQLREDTPTPATVLCDNNDYCPTSKSIVFGHHFTSIAGTGPIVGPAIAVMWGWLPAILWVLFGSVFIGAVHDLGALVVSLRNQGRSVGDIAGDLLGSRVRLIFLVVLVLAIWIVLAIFGLVVASVLRQYPGAIFPVLVQIPLAVLIGVFVHRHGKGILGPSIVALAVMYASVIWGDVGPLGAFNATLASAPMWAWVVGLLGYAYVASVLPVWSLLQPRDYINSLQLISSMGLLLVGLFVAATLGGAPNNFQGPNAHEVAQKEALTQAMATSLAQSAQKLASDNSASSLKEVAEPEVAKKNTARRAVPPVSEAPPVRPKLEIVAPMVNWQPAGAPPLLPVLFITIACGAVSGFHCLVGSGTTSKQIKVETDARAIGYGSMILEAFLATLVIAACAAGIGLGISRPMLNGMTTYGSWTANTLYMPVRDGTRYQMERSQGPSGGAHESADGDNVTIAHHFAIFHLTGSNPLHSSGSSIGPDGVINALDFMSANPKDYKIVPALARQDGSAPTWIPIDDGRSAVNGFIDDDVHIRGKLAFDSQYESWASAKGLSSTVGAFVEGAANLIKSIGVPASVAVALMGVLVASFAGTTMDTACRLQRYVIQELARTFLPRPTSTSCRTCGYELNGHIQDATQEPGPVVDSMTGETPVPPSFSSPVTPELACSIVCPECGVRNDVDELTSGKSPSLAASVELASSMNPCRWLATKHGATLFAVVSAAVLAGMPAPGQAWSMANFGQGGLILWPLFGATNQLLGGLSFLVVGAWLIATERPWWFMALPAVFMLVIPAWALVWQVFVGNDTTPSWLAAHQWPLVAVGTISLALETWLVIEVALRAARTHRSRRHNVSG